MRLVWYTACSITACLLASALHASPLVLNAWNTDGNSGITADGWQATTVASGVTTGELSRGSGITATSLANGFAASGWDEDEREDEHYAVSNPDPEITVQDGTLDFGAVAVGETSAPQSYTVSGTHLEGDITVTAPTGFELTTAVEGSYDSSVVVAETDGSVGSTTLYVRFAPTAAQAYSTAISHSSPDAVTRNKGVVADGLLAVPVMNAAGGITQSGFTANWQAVSGAGTYRLDVSTNAQFIAVATSRSTVFRETMGTVSSTTTVAAHETVDGFDNDAFVMSSGGAANPADIRTTSASSGYTDAQENPASGGANVFFTSTSGAYGFAVSGIDASSYQGLRLQFGYRKESASANATCVLEWSVDAGENWTGATVSGLPAADAGTGWYLLEADLPAGAAAANLVLRWVKSGAVAMRIDDVLLEGFAVTPSFAAGYAALDTGTATSQAVSGLALETTYHYRVRAVAGAVIGPNSQTNSMTTLAPDQASDIIRAADFMEPSNLDYAAFQAASGLTDANSIEVARVSIRDGGAEGDADSLPTTLTSLTLAVAGHTHMRRVALFDGDTNLAEADSAASIVFNDLAVVAPDNSLTNLSVRVTFQQSVTDKAQLQFTVMAAMAAPAGSGFALADAGGAASSADGERNRIVVNATELVFTTLPSVVTIGTPFTVAVEARDANGNRDFDADANVAIVVAAGPVSLSGGDSQALDAGAGEWTGLQVGGGGAFTLRAQTASLFDVTSGSIESGDTLEAGDITILGYRTMNPDGFAFVTWKHIRGGTVLGFWDHSANADGSFRLGEDRMTWAAPSGGVSSGMVVVVECPESGEASASIGTVDGKLDGLAQAGDQIFAGVGGPFPPNGGSGSYTYEGTLLYGLNTHAPWLVEGDTTAALSYLPPALNGEFLNQAFVTGVNNGQYTGERGTYTTWEQYRALTHDPANWMRENAGTTVLDATPFTLGTLVDEPTVQAAAIQFEDVTPYEARVSWTPGDGAGRVVLCRLDVAPDTLPTDGFPLTANPVLGAGGSLLGDAQVVYAGNGTTFRISGLAPTNTYVLQVFEYNGAGGIVNYLTNSAAANPAMLATPPGPPVAPGNLLVHLVDGDGSSLSGAAARVSIREYTRTGRLVNQWDMPHGESGTRLTATGDSDVEGKLSVAPGGAFAAVVGYDAAAGTATVRTNLTRTIGRLDLRAGEWDFSTTGPLGGDNTARAVAVDDTGTNFWTILHADAPAQQGLRHSELGQTTTGTQLAARNLRGVRLFGDQLYQYGAAGAYHGVFRVGDGLPVSGTPGINGLTGISDDAGLSTTGFFMADISDSIVGYDTLWMARYTIGNQVGVTKYSKVEGGWIANSTNQTGEAIVHLDGKVEDGVAHIFIIQGTSAGSTRLMHLADDTGYNQPMAGTFNELAVADAHQVFRGVAVIPADADDDGIPDWWELGWFGDLDSVDPDTDFSGSGVTAIQAYWAGTDPTDSNAVMRITGLDLADVSGDDVMLTFHAGANRSYVIRAGSEAGSVAEVAATILTGTGGTLDWTDTDAFADGPRRYYRLGVEHDGGGYTNIQQWAAFRQPRTPGRQELVSVPVNYPGGGNNLNAALGTHLARGLYANDTEEDADKIRWRDGDGNWVEYLLSVTHGWTQPGLDATANVELPPGTAVWVVRGDVPAARDNAVFAGPVVVPDQAAEVLFPTNTWTAAGWPLPTPGYARRADNASDQLGFTNATGGTRGELGDARSGDQLWVWRAGGGWNRYWLVDAGDPSHPAHRRWFGLNDYADITLQPGDAFYYFNSTNHSEAANFKWKAQP